MSEKYDTRAFPKVVACEVRTNACVVESLSVADSPNLVGRRTRRLRTVVVGWGAVRATVVWVHWTESPSGRP